MLEDLINIHIQVINNTPLDFKRYLFKKINWDAQSICLLGGRGVGKTTLMCQYLVERYQDVSQALYISADNVHVLSQGLFSIAQEYFKFGGQALFIDEIHKYPNWALEVKNILDTYKNCQIIFSASSFLDLQKSKYDLSRRVVYHHLYGLSFREYLYFNEKIQFPALTITELLANHVKIADQFKGLTILKHFRNYLTYGYFPFFLEGTQDYLSKLNNVIEKIIFEDIAIIYNLRQTTLPVLKKLLWLVATSHGLTPNIDRISKDFHISREVIYNCLEYLQQSGLLNSIYLNVTGLRLTRKPGKIYLENTNLLFAINSGLKLESDRGVIRETFFINQISCEHRCNLQNQGDFSVDGQYIFEIGGQSKDFSQIKSTQNSYLAIDNLEIGFANKIPLFLFGFLY